MLRVVEQYAVTDTGRQRRANEDSLLARSPLFVVADGMGGAQAGEVASRIAVESFQPGVEGRQPELELAALAHSANARIYELSHANAAQAGMGTTLTAVYVGEHEVAIAHVGDSRAYCLRDGELLRLTDDHSLVDELMRQGQLTPEEAVEHPQRSVITRALGPEGTVDVDTRSVHARGGDVYLLCSDGLTTMLSEDEIAALLRQNQRLRDAGGGARRSRQRRGRARQHHGRAAADRGGAGRSGLARRGTGDAHRRAGGASREPRRSRRRAAPGSGCSRRAPRGAGAADRPARPAATGPGRRTPPPAGAGDGG